MRVTEAHLRRLIRYSLSEAYNPLMGRWEREILKLADKNGGMIPITHETPMENLYQTEEHGPGILAAGMIGFGDEGIFASLGHRDKCSFCVPGYSTARILINLPVDAYRMISPDMMYVGSGDETEDWENVFRHHPSDFASQDPPVYAYVGMDVPCKFWVDIQNNDTGESIPFECHASGFRRVKIAETPLRRLIREELRSLNETVVPERSRIPDSEYEQVDGTIQSAGVIIIDSDDVLVLRAYRNWGFPKGRLEPGEAHLDAAVRETAEESGLLVGEDYELTGEQTPSTTYGSGKSRKTATYFLASRISDKQPTLPINDELGKPEHDEWRWVSIEALNNVDPETGIVMPKRLRPVIDYVTDIIGGEEIV